MRIIYLDQNQWVKLARAIKYPHDNTEISNLSGEILGAVSEGKICLPLTATNIYETFKINNPERRHDLSLLQSKLSQGVVFAGRHRRIANEISSFVKDICGLPIENRAKNWFLSDLFFEAFADLDDDRTQIKISPNLLSAMRDNPSSFLFDYLFSTPDVERLTAVRKWSAGSEKLRKRMEQRRLKLENETMAMCKRVYGAALWLDEYETILQFSRIAGAPWHTISDLGDSIARRLIDEVPAYHIERELAVRIELLKRPIEENDFRDMTSFCATIPYADCVISENLFVNLARQSKLDKRFKTLITTDLTKIRDFL